MSRLQQRHHKLQGLLPTELCVMATGGGAFKYYDKIRGALDVEVLREDEMECLIIGTSHLPSPNAYGLTHDRSRLFHH